MHAGFCRIELRLYGVRSLKAKRALILPLKAKLQSLFNVACAEVAELNHPQLAVLGFSCVSNSGVQARKIMDQVVNHLQSSKAQFEVVDHCLEVTVF